MTAEHLLTTHTLLWLDLKRKKKKNQPQICAKRLTRHMGQSGRGRGEGGGGGSSTPPLLHGPSCPEAPGSAARAGSSRGRSAPEGSGRRSPWKGQPPLTPHTSLLPPARPTPAAPADWSASAPRAAARLSHWPGRTPRPPQAPPQPSRRAGAEPGARLP